MEYGFGRGIWDGISLLETKRGNHALLLHKGQNFALFVLKIKLFFFLIQVFFRYNKAFIYHPLGRFGEILPSCMQ